LVSGAIDPLDHEVFQAPVGMVMTLLIAMEFKHSVIRVALRRSNIVQVKTVVLIALIALSRKFVILDIKETSASTGAEAKGEETMPQPLSSDIRQLPDRPNFAHLATLMLDGSPQSAPVWVGREGDRSLICTGEGSH
jgi:hypothetical protein